MHVQGFNYFSRVMFGPANIKIKLGILYPIDSHGKTSLPQYTAFNAFVLEQERVYYCSLDYLGKVSIAIILAKQL